MADEQELLRWQVTIPRKKIVPKSASTYLPILAIFVILLSIIPLFTFGQWDPAKTPGMPILFVGIILFILIVLLWNDKATFEYIITDKGVSKIDVGKSQKLNQAKRTFVEYRKGMTELMGPKILGSQYYRPFESTAHYEIKDNIVILVPKIKAIGFEFKIFPNNNLEQITSILDKFIPRK